MSYACSSPPLLPAPLPAVVRKSLVRFGHAVHIFFLLHGPATRVRRINQLIGQLIHHGLARALARILQQPANRQGLPPERVHFYGHLVVRAAHPPRLNFQQRLHVLDGLLENLQRVVVGLLGHLVHRAIKYALRRRFLAFPHHRANELLHDVAGIDRVGRLCPPENKSFAWHVLSIAPSKSFSNSLPALSGFLLRLRRLRPLPPVLGTPLLAVFHSRRVQRTPHDVISHPRQILHAPATHQHDRVLLQ